MRVPTADSTPPGEYYCPTCEQTFAIADRCPNDGTRLVKLALRIDELIGKELDGRYTILEKLGQGGMGAVYRAQQHDLGREVAIKVVNPHLITDVDVIKRFLREAKLAGRLAHPNAVSVMEARSTDDGLFYLVMELVTGRTLDVVIKSEKVFKPERVVKIGVQVCDALEAAHALQIVHRDLKPANIILLAHGRDLVKVLDFGLAKSIAPDQTGTTMTNAGALLGTPAYMPPELALGQQCDGRADLYSLGVILYQLGSGKLPFESESAHELVAMHGHDAAPPMTGVPPQLGKVIDRLLAKKPDDRYQTAVEARDALEAALEARYLTPVPWETNPSLGPFPAQSAEFANVKSIVPNATAAATQTIAPPAQPRARRRWWPVPLALGAIAAGGAAYYAIAMRGGDGGAKAAAIERAPATTPTRPPPTTTPDPAVAPQPPPSPAVSPPTAPPPAPEPATPPAVDTKPAPPPPRPRPAKPHRTQAKTVKPVEPATTSPPPPPPPPPQTGSAGSKKLPF